MLILALIVFGMIVGGLASLLIGGGNFRTINWGQALIAGLLGSFVGGLLLSLVTGNGLSIGPSGLIGSFVGAVIVLLIWRPKPRVEH
ncbi:MAG: GlsB/YeaQ/YmgE family stress response membrane protein [Candidatus Nanopelagicales bacterium]